MTATECGCGCDEPEVAYYDPLVDTLGILANKYALETISVIDAHGPMRFATLETHLPDASSSTLSSRLHELVDDGLATRTQYDEIPPRVEYELTERGHELRAALEPILEWSSAQEIPAD
ncbi:winged helix-turn-helix transcriptional regulator [Natronococcus occultus]|uniref:Putative transcriptional regulator n=1 Tax=Natronococcus occultus SP4 TaxID=694430 RepID=L0K4T8_9EURY|nr:helix-turn-helix domain-containing protein [Natronococcus occultus]AGB39133.1 putative transcriptional regulator [Natronococcus occultus SP4]